MIFTGTELVCPAGAPGASPLILGLESILRAEQRQGEVAFVTPMKAPELLREFNIAWRDLHKITVQLAAEQLRAERELEKRKAVLILEVVPGILKEKGLGSNEANRDAVITLDEKHQQLQEVVDEIDAIVRYLKGKLAAFENAFTSVKKIMGEDVYNMQGRQNPNLKGGAEPARPTYVSKAAEELRMPAPELPAPPPPPKVGGFGKAKY